ncbi:MAG: Hsp20/alpha crystallin family protein [Bacteroidia bacterium]
MTQLKKRRNGNGSLFPSLTNDFFRNRLFAPGFIDIDDDFVSGGIKIPLANVRETKDDFRVELSAPGLTREDFKVDLEDGVLTVSCEKKEESEDKDENYTRREFSYNSFTRTFQIPENSVEEKINAKYENGMLKIVIPKKETSSAKPKKEIQVG